MLCAANEDVTVWATQRAHALSAWHKGTHRHHRLRGCGRYPAAFCYVPFNCCSNTEFC